MNKLPILRVILTAAAAGWACPARAQTDAGAPHLETRGMATQLVVDSHPYLVLGGELSNTATSSPEYMRPVWPRLARMNLNTVLAGVSWALLEPAEGHYDFSLVDDALQSARDNHLHLILIWFASWKNGISSFAPGWVKADQARFPRVQVQGGRSIEVLSTLGQANREADARAFAALMGHLREADGTQHTVLMIQLENEVGVLGDSRDRSAAAEAAFAGQVPAELTGYLTAHLDRLRPQLAERWAAAGSRTAGTWTEVFGSGAGTDEIFMAWHYARYMDQVAAAGKAQCPLPIFTNTWIVQPEDHGPGDYPSGGPEPQVLDVWRAGAPHIDINGPDIYLPDFTGWVGRFHQNGNPLFVPESRGDAQGVANAFYDIGRESGIGYSPFGIDNLGRLLAFRPRPQGQPAAPAQPTRLEDQPLAKGYALLRELTPLILDAQAKGTLTAVSLNADRQKESLPLGDYLVNFDLRRNFRDPTQIPPFGYGLAIALGPNEYLVAGSDIQVTFTPRTPGPPVAGLSRVEAGDYANGKWVPGRVLNGDDILLNYHLAAAAAENQSGSGLKFMGGSPMLQRVWLYRYR